MLNQNCDYQIREQLPLKVNTTSFSKTEKKAKRHTFFLTHLRRSHKFWFKSLVLTAPFNASQLFSPSNC